MHQHFHKTMETNTMFRQAKTDESEHENIFLEIF